MGDLDKLDRNDVIQIYSTLLDTFELSNKDIWLSSGAALVMHGFREFTSDLDIGCTTATISKVSKKIRRKPVPFPQYVESGETKILKAPEWQSDFHTEDKIDVNSLTYIENVCVYSLEELLEQKKRMLLIVNRSDVKLLQDLKDYRNISFKLKSNYR